LLASDAYLTFGVAFVAIALAVVVRRVIARARLRAAPTHGFAMLSRDRVFR
jgi:hypothetical protein